MHFIAFSMPTFDHMIVHLCVSVNPASNSLSIKVKEKVLSFQTALAYNVGGTRHH